MHYREQIELLLLIDKLWSLSANLEAHHYTIPKYLASHDKHIQRMYDLIKKQKVTYEKALQNV